MGRADKQRVRVAQLDGCYSRRHHGINVDTPALVAELDEDIAELETAVTAGGGDPAAILAGVVERWADMQARYSIYR